jgi:asparagine synthase (glutamine-hydrolysing)
MSRIAGIITPEASNLPTVGLASLFRSLGPPHWVRASHAAELASLGWTGWRLPRLHADNGVIAAFDGFIFNAEDGNLDRAFANPAAALCALFRRHGFAGALRHINGDFAAALFDEASCELWLARDRVGHRPLYYVQTADIFAFASMPHALLALPGVSPAVNRRFAAVFAGSHYRYIDNRPHESPFEHVAQLPAATILHLRHGTVGTERYWDLGDSPDHRGDERELAERYRDLLIDSVRRRLPAIPRRAFSLSGGMDSSSILSCAVAETGEEQEAFSTVYSDKTFDESDDVKAFLHNRVSTWHPVAIENFDLLATVRRMVEAHGEPVATATWLSHFLMCEQVRRDGFQGLFGGLGGDELNAGEYEYFFFHFADLRQHGGESEIEHEVDCWARHHDHPIYRKNRVVAGEMIARSTDVSRPGWVWPDRKRLTKYFPAVSPDFFDLSQFEPEQDHPFASWLKNRSYQDIFRETAPCCLRAEDRDCTAFELDHADPFFDYRLMEFMFRVPGAMKIRDGVTKRLLREAMTGILPEETRTRVKKTGWNAPAHLWFSRDARAQVNDMIGSRAFRERGIYDIAEVRRLMDEHARIVESGAPAENHMMFLWQMVNLETWLDWCDTLGRAATAALDQAPTTADPISVGDMAR